MRVSHGMDIADIHEPYFSVLIVIYILIAFPADFLSQSVYIWSQVIDMDINVLILPQASRRVFIRGVSGARVPD